MSWVMLFVLSTMLFVQTVLCFIFTYNTIKTEL